MESQFSSYSHLWRTNIGTERRSPLVIRRCDNNGESLFTVPYVVCRKARCQRKKCMVLSTQHTLAEKFDDFGIIIKVAVCVPVRFSEQYAWNGEGSLWLSSGAVLFSTTLCRLLRVMSLWMFPFSQIGKNNVCSWETVDTVATGNMDNNFLRQQLLQNFDSVHYNIDYSNSRFCIYYTALFGEYNKRVRIHCIIFEAILFICKIYHEKSLADNYNYKL